MTEKIYTILLDDKIIGTTKLEFGDPPVGVVFGQISFVERDMGYDFIRQFCIENSIEIQIDHPTDKLISTGPIKNLKIYNSINIELAGIGNNIEGMDTDSYIVTILGIDSEKYKQEFPEHIAEYEQKFNKY